MPNGNYWVDYDGERYETSWLHGRKLTKLQVEVALGTKHPTDVDVPLAGGQDAGTVTIHVGPGHTLEVTPVEIYRRSQE